MTLEERLKAIDKRCEVLGLNSVDLLPTIPPPSFMKLPMKEFKEKVATLLEKILDVKEKDKK